MSNIQEVEKHISDLSARMCKVTDVVKASEISLCVSLLNQAKGHLTLAAEYEKLAGCLVADAKKRCDAIGFKLNN
jgi:hypothetical protein